MRYYYIPIFPFILLFVLLSSSWANEPPKKQKLYRIGTWNLEWLNDGKLRGFPEYTYPVAGTKYPVRKEDEYFKIAGAIKNIGFEILVLQEINGYSNTQNHTNRSRELDRLVLYLGDNYSYILGESGGSQRLAILYNKNYVKLNYFLEIPVPKITVERKQLFSRYPLVAFFTFLENKTMKNDLIVMDLHLASGRKKVKNHDRAMYMVLDELKRLKMEESFAEKENDIVIMGDFNADRFDNSVETFWLDFEMGGWDVLSDDPSYSATRLSGVPLKLNDSRLDYIIVTSGNKGLAGNEIIQNTAIVHSELINGNSDRYRMIYSDHLPVSVDIAITEDDD